MPYSERNCHTVYFKRKDHTERVAEKLQVLAFIYEAIHPKGSKSLYSTSGSNWLPDHHSSLHLFYLNICLLYSPVFHHIRIGFPQGARAPPPCFASFIKTVFCFSCLKTRFFLIYLFSPPYFIFLLILFLVLPHSLTLLLRNY